MNKYTCIQYQKSTPEHTSYDYCFTVSLYFITYNHITYYDFSRQLITQPYYHVEQELSGEECDVHLV